MSLNKGMWGLLVRRKLEGSHCLWNATQSDGPSRNHDFCACRGQPRIRAALADAGYGTSYQAGVVALLDELLIGQGREPLRSRS